MKERFKIMVDKGLMTSEDTDVLMRFDKGEVSLLEVISLKNRFERYLKDADTGHKISLYVGFIDLIEEKENFISNFMDNGELVRII